MRLVVILASSPLFWDCSAPFLFMTLMVLRNTAEVFSRMFLSLGLSDVLFISLGLQVLGRNITEVNAFLVSSCQGIGSIHLLSVKGINCYLLVEVVSVRFLHCKVTISPISNSSLVLHLQPQPQHVPSHILHPITPGSFRPLHLRTCFA